jgi:hypothetical protein
MGVLLTRVPDAGRTRSRPAGRGVATTVRMVY